ncbi:hypothetical protein SK74_02888 [Escherichia coli]|nr:hypothetical protein SK74_02888 [Escherichia coli]
MVGSKHLFKTTTRVFAIAVGGFLVIPELIHRLHQRLAIIRRNHATTVTGSFKPSGLFPPALQK